MSSLIRNSYSRFIWFALWMQIVLPLNKRLVNLNVRSFFLLTFHYRRYYTSYITMWIDNNWMISLNWIKITFRFIRSTCIFWFSSSDPISIAIFLKLPIIVFTWPIFSSISSSRASFVILQYGQLRLVFGGRTKNKILFIKRKANTYLPM